MYFSLIAKICECDLDFSILKKKTILITGGTGLVGTVLTQMFLKLDEEYSLNLKLCLVSRNREKFNEKFFGESRVVFLEQDMSKSFEFNEHIDYIIHLAANTHPMAYANFPVETITINVLGTLNLLELCKKNPGSRFLNLSSVEIYGENNSNKLYFDEKDFGFIDCNTVRAGYNESKRTCEALCQAYLKQFGVDFVTARLCRCYGPTLQKDDSKALSQFIFKAINGEDIVLKSEGNQFFSYIDVFSACTALITILLKGKCGEAYNISDKESDIKLKDLASLIANYTGTKVIFELPNENEKSGFSKATIALLDSQKLMGLGWKPIFCIKDGIKATLELLR